MTKSSQLQDSNVSSPHSQQGCIRSLLHSFNHQRWYNVRKMLPHRRHTSAKHSVANGDPGCSVGAAEKREISDAETEKSVVEAKVAEHKTSMKSRIKALITEEMSKRRGKHRRSSSYPARLRPIETNSVDNLNSTTNQIALNDETPGDEDNVQRSVASLLDPILPKVHDELTDSGHNCELCDAVRTMKCLRQSEVNGKGKQPIRDHTFLQDKSIYAIEPSKTASLQESKLFLDALDLLNLRKELFLKVLKDPTSSLAHQLHGKRLSKSRVGLTKSVSFPVPGSSTTRSLKSNCEQRKHKAPYCSNEAKNLSTFASAEELKENLTALAACREESTTEELRSHPEPIDITSPVVRRHENKIVLKRFKNLGEKIKHAIKDSKKDRQRLVMDAMLHKIPHGRKSPKAYDKPIEIYDKSSPGSSYKSVQRDYRRTSSFNESLHIYNQLVESDLKREVKGQSPERSRLKVIGTPSPTRSNPKKLSRILSLPELKSYYASESVESPGNTPCDTPVRFGEQNLSDSCSSLENQIQLDNVSERESQENFVSARESYDNLGGLELGKSASSGDLITENKLTSSSELEESRTGPQEYISEDPEYDSLSDQQHEVHTDSSKKSYDDIFQLQVEMKNKAEFDYVKDVLELSGFSRNDFLGRWHSAESPLGPSVFEEVEECLLSQPELYETEVHVSCDHLLLFDLINEVLLDIYEKSSSYWPMALTSRSRIYHMPVGYHVLKYVWADISYYLRWNPESDQLLDDAVSRDLEKSNGWMNLQFDGECVGLELEELILDDLLEELVTDFSEPS